MAETTGAAIRVEGDSSLSQKYLTFTVEDLECAVPVSYVTEIIRCPVLDRLPGLSGYYHGVINLRSRVIPILDTHHRLGLPHGECGQWTPIIVLELECDAVGILVDTVTEVVEIPPALFEEHVRGTDTSSSYPVRGMARLADRLAVVLDPALLVSPPAAGEQKPVAALLAEGAA